MTASVLPHICHARRKACEGLVRDSAAHSGKFFGTQRLAAVRSNQRHNAAGPHLLHLRNVYQHLIHTHAAHSLRTLPAYQHLPAAQGKIPRHAVRIADGDACKARGALCHKGQAVASPLPRLQPAHTGHAGAQRQCRAKRKVPHSGRRIAKHAVKRNAHTRIICVSPFNTP